MVVLRPLPTPLPGPLYLYQSYFYLYTDHTHKHCTQSFNYNRLGSYIWIVALASRVCVGVAGHVGGHVGRAASNQRAINFSQTTHAASCRTGPARPAAVYSDQAKLERLCK